MTLLRLIWLALVGPKGLASRPSSLSVRAGVWRHYRIAGKPLELKLPSSV